LILVWQALDPVPVDFQDTEVTSTSFMSNPTYFLDPHILEKLNEQAVKKRATQHEAHEELTKRYNDLLALHATGVFQKVSPSLSQAPSLL